MASENHPTRQLRLATLCVQRKEIGAVHSGLFREAKRLEAKLLDVDRQISRLAPVYNLPDEVLLEIL